MTQPEPVTEESELHARVCPAAIITFSGPCEPLYRVPPIVIPSKRDSVLKEVAVARSPCTAVTTHRSLLP